MTVLIANLDAERQLARRARPEAGSERIRASVRSSIAAASTLMSALAEPGDALWTVAEVDPARLPDVPGVPRVRLLHGDAPLPAGERVYWCPMDDVAGRVNHRVFGHTVARHLGATLPGACVVRTLDELRARLAEGDVESWVLKGAYGAAGRARLRYVGDVLADDALRRAERLFARYDALVFEPWVERTADFGCTGVVDDTGPGNFAAHGLLSDRRGVFKGCALVADERALGFTERERRKLTEAVIAAGRALHGAGYRGPYGIDAYRWRDDRGRLRFNPMSEINARMTFGWLARALVPRVLRALGIDRRVVRLRVAIGERATTIGRDAIPLVLPAEDEPTAAWLEL